VYASAPTNQAICELAHRCLREIIMGSKLAGDTAATTTDLDDDDSDDDSDDGRPVRLDQLALVGSASRLVLNDDLLLLHVDARVDRLDEAACAMWQLMILSIWRKWDEEDDEVDSTFVCRCREVVEAARTLVDELPESILKDGARAGLRSKIRGLSRLCAAVQEDDPESLQAFAAARPTQEVRAIFGRVRGVEGLRPQGFARRRLKKDILAGARLVFSTVSTAGSRAMVDLRQDGFNVALIDEATQLVEASTAIMLSTDLCCLVLAGDNKQLPATVISQRATEVLFGRRYGVVDW
jgi:hypothetical protein